MTTIELSNLPPGAVVRGFLYADPDHVNGLGDIMEIELPTGWTIDVGWDEDTRDEPFRIVVYREYFGDRVVDFRVRRIDGIVSEVQRLAADYSRSIPATGGSATSASSRPPEEAPMTTRLATCVDSATAADAEKVSGTVVGDAEKVPETVVATL